MAQKMTTPLGTAVFRAVCTSARCQQRAGNLQRLPDRSVLRDFVAILSVPSLVFLAGAGFQHRCFSGLRSQSPKSVPSAFDRPAFAKCTLRCRSAARCHPSPSRRFGAAYNPQRVPFLQSDTAAVPSSAIATCLLFSAGSPQGPRPGAPPGPGQCRGGAQWPGQPRDLCASRPAFCAGSGFIRRCWCWRGGSEVGPQLSIGAALRGHPHGRIRASPHARTGKRRQPRGLQMAAGCTRTAPAHSSQLLNAANIRLNSSGTLGLGRHIQLPQEQEVLEQRHHLRHQIPSDW